MANQLFGEATIRVDGSVLETGPGAKLSLGGVERETKTGTGWAGFTEKTVAAELECKIAHRPGFSPRQISDIRNATITFSCDTGQVYVMAQAWCATPATLTDGEGMDDFKFNSEVAEEML